MTIVVVIVIIPVALIVPAPSILIPPATRVFPAVGAGFSEFVAPVVCLRALPAVLFNRFVQLMIRFGDALLAVVVGAYSGGGCKRNCRRQRDTRERAVDCFQFGAQFFSGFRCEQTPRVDWLKGEVCYG